MLYYSLLFLVFAAITGFLGLGEIAIISAGIVKVLFFVFFVAFIISTTVHLLGEVKSKTNF